MNNCFLKLKKKSKINLVSNHLYVDTFLNKYKLTSFMGKNKINSYSVLHKYSHYIKKNLNIFEHGWFLELNLEGLGFKSYFYNNKLIIDMGYSNILEYDFKDLNNINNYSNILDQKYPICVFLKNKKIILVSYDRSLIYNFSYFLRSYRKFDSYKMKGLKFSFESIKLKVGKVRV